MLSVKKYLWFAAMIGFILGLNWLFQLMFKPTLPAPSSQKVIDEYMMGAFAVRYDKEGKISEQLDIQEVYHVQGDEFMVLKSPRLTLHRPKLTWTVKANEGKSFFDKDNIFHQVNLEDRVEITMENHEPGNWRLLTDALTVFPKEEIASTDSAVRLYSGNLLIEGTGMVGWLKLGQVNLNHEVSSYYEMPNL